MERLLSKKSVERIVGWTMMQLHPHGEEVRMYLLCHNNFGENKLRCAISNFNVTKVCEDPNNIFADKF